MKKVLAGILAGVMAVVLVSCNERSPKDMLDYTTPPTETTATTESGASTETTASIVLPEPTLTVTEEIDWEHKAVKITLTGDGMYYFPNFSGVYIENYQYELGVNSSGRTQVSPLPMDPPVVLYYQISSYIKRNTPIEICKVDANGKIYRVEYELSLDIASYLSDEPLKLQDEFLHAVMTDYFGGEYSERDLLEIGQLYIGYYDTDLQSGNRTSNRISITDPKGNYLNYYHSDFFDTPIDETPSVIPDETLEDLGHFHGLYYVTLTDKSDSERMEMYKQLTYQTVRGYEVTKNTWSQNS